MDCKNCQGELSRYVEGELKPSVHQQVESHLAGCLVCRQEEMAFRKIVAELRTLPQPSVPEEFRKKVWEKIDHPQVASRLRQWFLEPWYFKIPVQVLATAAVVMLVIQVSRVTVPQVTKLEPVASGKATWRVASVSEGKVNMESARKPVLKEKEQAEAVSHETATLAGVSMKKKLSVEVKSPVVRAASAHMGMDIPISLKIAVSDVAQAQREFARLLEEIHHSAPGSPEPSVYYLLVTPEEWNILMDYLTQVGTPGPLQILEKLPEDFPLPGPSRDLSEPAARKRPAVLKFVPSETRQNH